MSQINPYSRQQAEIHFQKARQQARWQQLSAWFSGRENILLPFESVRSEMRSLNPCCKGLRQIPMDRIVGSVGRYKEFTRHYLPLSDDMKERWIKVESLAFQKGWPPIEVYEVGDVYFVSDGNHRVAIARQMGNDTIEAYVWSFPEDIHIEPDEPLDNVLIRLGERNFMAQTQLETYFPEHGLVFTAPGRYRELLAQIRQLQQTLIQIDEEDIIYEEAVQAWYEMLYLPAVQIIEESGMMEHFPGRTTSDLFVWLSTNRQALIQQYGDYDNMADLVEQISQDQQKNIIGKGVRRVLELLGRPSPAPLTDLPTP